MEYLFWNTLLPPRFELPNDIDDSDDNENDEDANDEEANDKGNDDEDNDLSPVLVESEEANYTRWL